MKITKSRLLQIIREEVELHEKKMEENTFVFEETDLEDVSSEKADKNDDGELSDKESKEAINKEIESDKDAGNIDEVEKVKHKGKTYKASDATMKAIRGGAGGAGKVTPAEFKKAVKQAKSWADDPEAVAAAGRIVAKKKAGTMEESDVGEDLLLTKEKPHKVIEPEKNDREKLEIKIR